MTNSPASPPLIGPEGEQPAADDRGVPGMPGDLVGEVGRRAPGCRAGDDRID
jgi:hypothetical protein